MKIVIFSLENISNAGDEILGDTTQYLVESVINNQTTIERVQLTPKKGDLKKNYFFNLLAGVLIQKTAKLFFIRKNKGNIFGFRLTNLGYVIKSKRFYKDALKNTDIIIYAVGMLKYSTQNFSYVFSLINHLASKQSIPVLMSAMSIEKPNEHDWRYLQLVDAVNEPSVKIITSRDGVDGVKRLQDDYINRKILSDYVGDPALWVPECYSVKKNNHSNTLGIGLIRKNIFKDYGTPISEDAVYRLYEEMIKELEKRQMDYVLFANGIEVDYEFGLELISKLNLSKEKLRPRPTNSKEFVEMVANFKAVFGARLHASITPFSLGIPVVGMYWDDKLRYFAKTMGIEDSFFAPNKLDATSIIDRLQMAKFTQKNMETIQKYKTNTKISIENLLENLVDTGRRTIHTSE